MKPLFWRFDQLKESLRLLKRMLINWLSREAEAYKSDNKEIGKKEGDDI